MATTMLSSIHASYWNRKCTAKASSQLIHAKPFATGDAAPSKRSKAEPPACPRPVNYINHHTNVNLEDIFDQPFHENSPVCSLPEEDYLLSQAEFLALTDEYQAPAACLPDVSARSLGNCQEKRKRSASDLKPKDHVHIERERRKAMKDLLETMGSLLPHPLATRKKDKVSLVSNIIEHITVQKQKIEELKQKRADLDAKKLSLDHLRDLSGSEFQYNGLHINNQSLSVAPSLSLPHVLPYVKIHESGKNSCNVLVKCKAEPKAFPLILTVVNAHHLKLVNVHISSNETMTFYNLHNTVKDGSSLRKDDLHKELQQLIAAI